MATCRNEFSRDVTIAYVISTTKLERPVQIQAPKEMGLYYDICLPVVKTLYGMPESGLHWYLTYLCHHLDRIGLRRARTYPCVLYDGKDGTLKGLVALDVEDLFGVETEELLNKEATKSEIIKIKPRAMLGTDFNTLNGFRLRQDKHGNIISNQEGNINTLSPPKTQK